MDGPVIEGFKLSPQQRHLWSHFANAGTDACCLVEVRGALDAERLLAALRQVAERHEVLRTTLELPPGLQLPVQVIAPQAEAPVRRLDLSVLEPHAQREALGELVSAEVWRRVDRASSVLRGLLVQLGHDEQILLLSVLPFCADTWTLHELVHEVAAAYRDGRIDLPEPFQYADFSEWQNGLEAEPDAEGAGHWRRLGHLCPSSLSWSFASTAASAGAFVPERVAWRIGPQQVGQIEELAARHGASASAVLLAVWQVLLRRWTQERELLIGDVCAGRKFEPLQSAFGLFAKVLPFAAVCEDDFRFEELLERTAKTLAENHAWQEYFSWPARQGESAETAAAQCFPLAFEWDDRPTRFEAAGVVFSIRRIHSVHEPFHVQLRCAVTRDGYLAELCFDPHRFRRDAAGQLAGQIDALLGHILADPGRRVGEIPLASPHDSHRALLEANDSAFAWADPAGIHQLVEAQAKRTPEAVAVSSVGEDLTYGELQRRIEALARRLRHCGLGRGEVAAVLLERSPELIISLLAVLRAGGAFVVITPEQPATLLAHALTDTAARLTVTLERLRPSLPAGGPEVLCLDRLSSPADDPGDDPAVDILPEDLAYVVYTSGSSGRPKGVLATHRGVRNYLGYLTTTYALGPGDRVLQLASPGFDAAVRDLLGPLACGARVVLPAVSETKDPAALLRRIEEQGVTAVLSIVPTLLRALLAAAPAAGSSCRSVRLVLISGEVLHRSDSSRLRDLIRSDAVVVNQYGPTECTMTSTYHRIAPGPAEGEALPIGRPIPNARLYLLGADLSPVAGEVYIGGPGLAWGYLNQPDLTAQCFVPDPFGREPGSRLYWTGDLARALPDGTLLFLGRRDAQVKVRGIRIELGEIEALLRRHPDLREVAVNLWETAPGDQRLVVYAVPSPGAEPRLSELRHFLQTRLPETLLPNDLVLLGSLPLTRTGKLDRRALPLPGQKNAGQASVAPRTATEELLAEIWRGVLGLERVGARSDFFELGGHSLLATQLVARVRKVFQVELPLQSLFERPTLELFARAIDEALREGERYRIPPIVPVSREGALPLSFAQQSHWFLHQLEPESPLLNNPTAIFLAGPLDVAGLESGLAAIVRRHEVLRTGFAATGGEPVLQIASEIALRIPVVDLSGLPESPRDVEQAILIQAELQRPFDLRRPPLLRATLLRSSGEGHVFLLILHHIASDLWSIGVLIRELAALYEQAVAGTPARLPELSVQYPDFAAWQRQWMAGGGLPSQLEYWKRQLADPPPLLDLASGWLASPAIQRSRQCPLAFSADLTARLKALSRAEGATLFMTLLAGFLVVLHYASGREDIVVGTPFANRMRPEVEPLIGCFINAVALRVKLAGNPAFRDLIGRARRVVLQGNAHQDIPFEKVVEELNPERAAGRLPLFNVVFNFQNVPLPETGLSGLAVSVLEMDSGAEAKYDLTLYLRETEGRLVGTFRYNVGRLDPLRVEELAKSLEKVLEIGAEDAGTQLTDLLGVLAAAAERRISEQREGLREARLQKLRKVAGRSPQKAVECAVAPLVEESPIG